FACRTGVAAKCDRWGYGPNTTWPKQTAHNNPISVSGADVYQTCTRMARADYCAQAVPNTIDGTPIYIEDNFHLRGTQPGYVFEAAWRDNAWADGKTVTGKQVICLSKLRWATLPLGGNCPLTVPDPRVSRKGRFCDDMTDADFDNAGAVMFSSSALIDTGLATYSDATTGQHLTTTKLQPQTEGQVPQWTISPPADLHFPTHTQPTDTPRFEATLLRTQLPEGFDTSGLVKLNSYDCGGSPVTTTTQPDGCAPLAEEGYVYATALDRAPLRRWRNRTTGQSWTTVTSPTTMWSQGVDLVEVIGGVVRASLDVNVRWTAVPGTSYALDVQLRTGEWIPHCIDAATLGNAVSVAFTGVCTGMANRQINHSDIAQFRMSYDGHYANQVYDGFASDVYIAATNVQPPLTAAQIKGSQPTALSFSWKDVGNATYVISLSSSAGSCKVAVANDTAFVYTGTCPAGGVLPARVMRGVTLCAYDKASGTSLGCTETKLDGKTATWPLTFTP
ncbi:MAG TPA: ADYC domain-containing protein, partial [Kofleriaceae bacterium]